VMFRTQAHNAVILNEVKNLCLCADTGNLNDCRL